MKVNPAAPQPEKNAAARARIGTILVPTDFSEESLKALDYAAALLREFPGTLHLVHVRDLDYSYAVPPLLMVEPIIANEEMERVNASALRDLAAKYVQSGQEVTAHVKIGRAFDAICAVARVIEADLLVIATHGHTGLKHLMLGSTAERVVQHSPCPVLVVREKEHDIVETSARGTRVRLRKILVPMDFSACARHGLHYSVALAKVHGARLVLLHSIQVPPVIPTERYGAYDRLPSAAVLERTAREQMHKVVSEMDFAGVPYETIIDVGRPAHQICGYAAEFGVDMIVTSTHGLTGFSHVLIGSTAEHVVRYARCPVLVIPRHRGCAGADGKAMAP